MSKIQPDTKFESEENKGFTYNAIKIAGNGSFGIVYEAIETNTGEVVAIKKVLQDRRYKNRELQIMQALSHPNIVELKNHFYTRGEREDEIFLNIVMNFFKDNLYKIIKQHSQLKQKIPPLLIKLYSYQLLRGLAFIHGKSVCHRDVKIQNILIDPATHRLAICDFGSAKIIQEGEQNLSYICSRYYRAPELILGARFYGTKIDIWSTGCIIAEMLIGKPLFPGDSGVDQLVEIIKLLGTPSKEEMQEMNPSFNEYKFPFVKSHPWSKIFIDTDRQTVEFISKLLKYSPKDRPTAIESLKDPYFDELRQQDIVLSNDTPLPEIFNWTAEELSSPYSDKLHSLKPEWL